MWKLRIVVALVVSLAASVTLWASAAPALEKPRTFSLLEVDRTFHPLDGFQFDRAPVGGDRAAETNALYRWTGAKSKGARVGHSHVVGTFVTGFGTSFTHRATLLIQAQVYLPDGSLMIEGYASLRPQGPSTFKLPVIGGTGVYDNARGHIVARELGDGTTGRSKLDFRLVP